MNFFKKIRAQNSIKQANKHLEIIKNFSITNEESTEEGRIPKKWWFKRKEISTLKDNVDALKKNIERLNSSNYNLTDKSNILSQFSNTLDQMISLNDESKMESLRNSAIWFLDKFRDFNISDPTDFKSEIDWAKWNPEIPNNKDLLKEYHDIEKKTKKKGTWMKNKDGTPFQGTPEQFVQQISKNFKKAFPKGFAIVFRGAHQHIRDFKNRDRNDYVTFFTSSFENATHFSGKVRRYFHPETDSLHDWNDGVYQIALPNHFPRVIGEGEGRSWRLLNWDDKIAKGTTLAKRTGIPDEDVTEMLQEELKRNAIKEYRLEGQYDPNKKYLSTDIYANYIKNPKNKEKIFEIKNVKDGMTHSPEVIASVWGIDANKVPIKSLRYNNGMFDMNDSNIYK